MCLPNRNPSAAAGTNATTRFCAKRRAAASLARPAIAWPKRARYSQTTAIIAPDWIAISNTLALSPT